MKKISIIIFLLIVYLYICNITLLPSNIIIMQGEEIKLNTILGISINQVNSYNIVQTSSGDTNTVNTGKIDYKLSLFDVLKVKDITVNVIPRTKVVPLGKAIGMKLYTQGVLVVGMSEIEGKKPYEKSGIKEGDMIIEIDQKEINNTQDLINTVNKSQGENINIKYIRNEDTITTSIKPVKTQENEYKIGLWVRDGAIGVGTISYYEPSTKYFAALGHPIIDTDTGEIVSIKEGELVNASVISIKKGEGGNPGEIKGSLKSDEKIGQISTNTKFGIYGTLDNLSSLNIDKENKIKVALREEIKTGDAKVLLTLEDGIRKEYDVKIKKIYKNNDKDNKSMLIEIVDEDLKNLTGGIIQGMSGAPLIQNGKFIGAITHVLVNNPELGYAVFGDLMIKQMRCQW